MHESTAVRLESLSGCYYKRLPYKLGATMPFRFNNPRRHEFEKPKYRVRQSHDYERALQQRGNLTLWFTDTAIESWHPPQRADTSDCVRALQPVLAGPA